MFIRLIVPILSLALLITTGCQKKPSRVTNIPGITPGVGSGEYSRVIVDPDPGTGMGIGIGEGDNDLGVSTEDPIGEDPNEAVRIPEGEIDEETLADFTIYYNFDDATVLPSEFENLNAVAQYMKENPALNIRVEGHCDERGTAAYNTALGQSRANSARDYLVDSGINADRLSTLSWGEEKLASLGTTADDHAQNRRSQFVIIY